LTLLSYNFGFRFLGVNQSKSVLQILSILCRNWISQSGGYEEYYILGYSAVQSVESQRMFRRNTSPPISGSKNRPSKKSGGKLGLFCDPEVVGDMFARNFGWLWVNYMVVYPRRQYSSLNVLLSWCVSWKLYFSNLKCSENILLAEWLWCRKRIFVANSEGKFHTFCSEKGSATIYRYFTRFRKLVYEFLLLLSPGIQIEINIFVYPSPKYFWLNSNSHSTICFICLTNIGFLLRVIRDMRRNLDSRALKDRNCMPIYRFSGEEHTTHKYLETKCIKCFTYDWMHS
jgi:hypothetical protein